MERALVMPAITTRGRALLSLAASLGGAAALPGCFDVHAVDPGPVVLDDFEDGDLKAADPEFTEWSCRRFNPDTADGVTCNRDTPGYQGNFSIFVRATVQDYPNTIMEYGGAALVTRVAGPLVDMTRFTSMSFGVKVVSGDPPLPAGAQLLVELGCKNAKTDDGTRSDQLRVTQAARFKTTWQTVTLAMRDFSSPSFDPTHFAGGPSLCLSQVDSVRFALNAVLNDGASATFTMWFDSISFE